MKSRSSFLEVFIKLFRHLQKTNESLKISFCFTKNYSSKLEIKLMSHSNMLPNMEKLKRQTVEKSMNFGKMRENKVQVLD